MTLALEPPRLGAPGPGRTLDSVTNPIGQALRDAAIIVAKGNQKALVDAYTRGFSPRDSRVGPPTVTVEHAAWGTIGLWATVVGAARAKMGIDEAETEFFGGTQVGLSAALDADLQRRLALTLAGVDASALHALLPYVLGPLEPGTRLSVKRDPNEQVSRNKRRQHGVFYTPSDVADHMVAWILQSNEVMTARPILDPACGTGVFLARAATSLRRTYSPIDTLDLLYGVDLDPTSIDMTAFALAAAAGNGAKVPLWRLWHIARMNLAVADSLALLANWDALPTWTECESERLSIRSDLIHAPALPLVRRDRSDPPRTLREFFPEHSRGWSVIGNPPYAPLGSRPDLHSLSEHSETLRTAAVSPTTNTAVPFTELALKVADAGGRVCFVVPLAIAYSKSSSWRSLRRLLQAAPGEVQFRFFDRTPDSVFGDHVKQRVAIVYRKPSPAHTIRTSTFLRWTSRQRQSVFESDVPFADISDQSIAQGIPKLGFDWERPLYRALRARPAVDNTFVGSDVLSFQLAVGATAYNELNLFLSPERADDLPNVSTWRFLVDGQAPWAYGMLSSNLVYWLWRVEGDGFHVSSAWIQSIPLRFEGGPLDDELGGVGTLLWSSATKTPTWATNRGRRTIAYRTFQPELASRADQLLIGKLGLDNALVDELLRYRQELVSVGRKVALG